jgi:hypothetical protein
MTYDGGMIKILVWLISHILSLDIIDTLPQLAHNVFRINVFVTEKKN